MPSKSFGPTTVTADVKTTIGAAYTVPLGGTVRRIRMAFYQAVIAKATCAMLKIDSDRQTGPFEYVVGGSVGITTTSGATGPNIATEEILAPALGIAQGEIITVSLTASEALQEVTVSIEWA